VRCKGYGGSGRWSHGRCGLIGCRSIKASSWFVEPLVGDCTGYKYKSASYDHGNLTEGSEQIGLFAFPLPLFRFLLLGSRRSVTRRDYTAKPEFHQVHSHDREILASYRSHRGSSRATFFLESRTAAWRSELEGTSSGDVVYMIFFSCS
jgi:hypothetical protein